MSNDWGHCSLSFLNVSLGQHPRRDSILHSPLNSSEKTLALDHCRESNPNLDGAPSRFPIPPRMGNGNGFARY